MANHGGLSTEKQLSTSYDYICSMIVVRGDLLARKQPEAHYTKEAKGGSRKCPGR